MSRADHANGNARVAPQQRGRAAGSLALVQAAAEAVASEGALVNVPRNGANGGGSYRADSLSAHMSMVPLTEREEPPSVFGSGRRRGRITQMKLSRHGSVDIRMG